MNQLKSNEVLQSTFNFCSQRQCLILLDCSKFHLRRLVNDGTIKVYYLEMKDGKYSGKPYYNLREIEGTFIPKEVSIN